MKASIHPEYVLANVHCSCGNQFYTRSTKPDLHVELCSACHPFYTGKQKLVDTGGRVERFQRRGGDSLRKLTLDLLVGRLQQPLFASEVVIEGAAADSGGAYDLLGANRRVSALGKELAGGADQGLAGRLRALRLTAARAQRATALVLDFHTVCMLLPTICM